MKKKDNIPFKKYLFTRIGQGFLLICSMFLISFQAMTSPCERKFNKNPFIKYIEMYGEKKEKESKLSYTNVVYSYKEQTEFLIFFESWIGKKNTAKLIAMEKFVLASSIPTGNEPKSILKKIQDLVKFYEEHDYLNQRGIIDYFTNEEKVGRLIGGISLFGGRGEYIDHTHKTVELVESYIGKQQLVQHINRDLSVFSVDPGELRNKLLFINNYVSREEITNKFNQIIDNSVNFDQLQTSVRILEEYFGGKKEVRQIIKTSHLMKLSEGIKELDPLSITYLETYFGGKESVKQLVIRYGVQVLMIDTSQFHSFKNYLEGYFGDKDLVKRVLKLNLSIFIERYLLLSEMVSSLNLSNLQSVIEFIGSIIGKTTLAQIIAKDSGMLEQMFEVQINHLKSIVFSVESYIGREAVTQKMQKQLMAEEDHMVFSSAYNIVSGERSPVRAMEIIESHLGKKTVVQALKSEKDIVLELQFVEIESLDSNMSFIKSYLGEQFLRNLVLESIEVFSIHHTNYIDNLRHFCKKLEAQGFNKEITKKMVINHFSEIRKMNSDEFRSFINTLNIPPERESFH